MIIPCVDLGLNDLAMLSREPRMSSPMKNQIQNLQLELRFLKMFLWCSKNLHPESVREPHIDATLGQATQGLYGTGVQALYRGDFQDWNIASSILLETIEQFKPKLQESCLEMLDCSLNHKFSSKFKLLKFLHFVIWNLKDLIGLRHDMIVAVKLQMNALQEKLCFCRDLFSFVRKRCVTWDECVDLIIRIQAWAYKAACLSLLYWVNGKAETLTRMNILLADLLQKMKPCTPEVARMYFEVLKASKSSPSDRLLMGEVVSRCVDFLLENLVVLENNDLEMLRQGLIFLLTLAMDQTEYEDDGKLIWTEITALVNEASYLICSLCVGELEESISKERYAFVSNFLEKINIVRVKVRQLQVQIPNSLPSDFPRTNAMGFVDFFLGNLKVMLESKANFVPFAKHQIVALHEELVSLRTFLKHTLQLHNEYQKVDELCMRIINVVYKTEHVIDSCSIIDAPVWYNLMRLSDVIEEIQFIKVDINKSRDKEMYNIRIVDAEVNPGQIIRAQANTLGMDEVIVGFTAETKTIIDLLTRGSSQLDIVSIVAMPGQGKTTLAKKVFNDPFVRFYFHKRAWCCVTQVHDCKELLHGILNDVIGHEDQISVTSIEELHDRVRKRLKGQRYLIVMDDIWDIRAWNELQESFPNDNNGSRIMFTSRIHKVALQAKPNCSPHLLRPFSDEESWELLQKKLFDDGACPPSLSKIGQQIVKNCKGLPLAVVLVAGLLAKNTMNLDWWKQIKDSVSSHVTSEGLMDIIELSYGHLPDALKPCFLYFGAFREDQTIRAQKLIRLWIAEGFVEHTRMKSTEDVAMEHLKDLIDRSLVTVAKRSSIGGVKECHVHDMLHDFCLSKSKEERFLHLPSVSHDSSKIKYDQYRLGIHHDWRGFVNSEPSVAGVRALLFNGDRKRARYLLDTGNSERYPRIPSFFIKFKLLKALDLEDVALATGDFLAHITSLIHLRYLTVAGSIYYVPSSIGNLWNLEIFHIKSSFNSVQLPKAIWKMKNLRHVHVNRPLVSMDIDKLEKFPQLENMETFSQLWLNSEENAEKQLRLLSNVRELGIHLSCHAHVPLSHLLRKLETLHVFGNWKAYCPWPFDFPSTLKKLTLHNMKLLQNHISTIGELPNLEVLKLVFVHFEGRTWDVEDERFLKLKFLKLHNCGVAQWNASSDHFPCLEQLILEFCHYLEEIPASFGDIATLKMIEILHCKTLVHSTARRILRDQFDMGNEGLVLLINGQEMEPSNGEH